MQAHCKDIKKRIPNAKTVFIGPCVAKKDEAQYYEGIVDAVLTFDELTNWLKAQNIELKPEMDNNENSRARFFPTTGGILKTMNTENTGYTYMAIDGTENCIAALRDIERGGMHGCFIEMSACIGSCVGGPVMEKFHRSPVRDYAAVSKFAGKKDFEVDSPDPLTIKKSFTVIERKLQQPSESEIRDTLRQMGKMKPSDELNCGSCGYNTCREKAVAILQGKAEISMCLPYLKDKAESFSDTIVRNTPNGLIVLNEKLEVQQINHAALRIVNVRNASVVLGDQVVRILDPTDFLSVLNSGKSIHDKRTYLAEYGKYVEESILYDKEYHLLVCILRDVTEEENQKEKKEKISHQTHPVTRGTAQNPDIYFQTREASNKFYDAIPDMVAEAMEKISEITGRTYKPFTYYGAPDAEHVVIALGSVTETLKETVDYLNAKGEKTGVVTVHLFRPFSVKYLTAVLPQTVKRICVLDRTKEPGANGDPLYMDVVEAFATCKEIPCERKPLIIGGRYGLSSKDTTPAQMLAVFANLKANEPKNQFTVGIVDDVTFRSLPVGEEISLAKPGTFEALFFGLGADGTVGANKNSIKIIGGTTDKYCQAYFAYDSKK